MNTDPALYYSERAKEYEKIYEKPERQEDLKYIAQFLKDIFNGRNILEIACGTGYWTQFISETAKSIFATDINQAVIEMAKTKVYNSPVDLALADLYDLSKSRRSSDAGFGGFIWSHIPKQKLSMFITHFLSKITKDGVIIFIDNQYVEGSSTPIDSEDEYGNTYQRRRLENGSYHKSYKKFSWRC